ncbi:hypothetical protein [Stenotrophomonas sp. SY1]|jgi:hypothetical protein|uniref:hypothetical protein n=1 Tax=Stenotrophomonas sp. SY1 TaxID=477235 RepID=UPI001E4B7782|nr:hypothetical protein [Stenotrophomonas sp. SY1]MCD9086229.1 hypothetical protein [Stenotrophomonas sp. SY1]
MNPSIRELSFAEINEVDGGVVPLIAVAVAFGKGFAVGGAVAAGVLTVADALGVVDVM